MVSWHHLKSEEPDLLNPSGYHYARGQAATVVYAVDLPRNFKHVFCNKGGQTNRYTMVELWMVSHPAPMFLVSRSRAALTAWLSIAVDTWSPARPRWGTWTRRRKSQQVNEKSKKIEMNRKLSARNTQTWGSYRRPGVC